MKNNSLLLFTILCLCVIGCKEEKQFPIEKKYWDASDYETIVNELKYNTKEDDKLPTFDNPETEILLEKLTDEENFRVILDDKELGLKHKSEVAQKFFDQWQVMSDIYTETDRTDKYVYEKELLEVQNFGLELQIKYFKLGNDQIIEASDDPKSESVVSNVNSNVNTLVDNMMLYLDQINSEKSYSSNGLDLIAAGIDKNFTELINVYPNFDYESLLRKVNLMLNKTKAENVKQSLTNLKVLIESKKQQPETAI